MKRKQWMSWISLAILSAGASGFWNPGAATQFGQQEVNQTNVITIAAPVSAGRSYQLLVLEQLDNRRACWQDNRDTLGTVRPLLLNFDFTGICSRATDSNGYSIRVGGEDLGWRYSLRLVKSQNALKLVGMPLGDRNAPVLEIGKTKGITPDFSKIELNSGWRLTKRVYNGQTLGHFYLTNDQSLATLAAASPVTAANNRPTAPSNSSAPVVAPPAAAPRPIEIPVVAAPPQRPGSMPVVTISPTPNPLPIPVASPNGNVPYIGRPNGVLPPLPTPRADIPYVGRR